MARALLREGQIGDPDNLSEGEHDDLVHENLVTSGTLNFQDGTISGTGDVYATTFYGDGSSLTGVGGEVDSLYYSGTKVMESYISGTNEGFKLTHTGDGAGDATDIFFTQDSYGHLTIDNPTYQGRFRVVGTKAGDADSLMIEAYPHATVALYYGGDKTLETQSGGIRLWSGSNTTRLYHNGIDFYNYNLMQGGRSIFQSTKTGGGVNTLLIADPDGAAELYHAGVKAFATTVYGIDVGDGTHNTTLQHEGTVDFTIDNSELGGRVLINGSTTGGSPVSLGDFDPDFGTKLYRGNLIAINADTTVGLYYAGGRVFETVLTGVQINTNAGSASMGLLNDGSSTIIAGYIPGYPIVLTAINDGSVNKFLMIADPDGATELYHAGTKKVETTSEGISVPGGGVKFPATQVPSSDVNTLDDYEEGTWTPTVWDWTTGGNQGGGTLSGVYTKIGRMVTLIGSLTDITTAGMTALNPLIVRGLPFTASSDSSQGSVLPGAVNFQGGIGVSTIGGSTQLVFRDLVSNGAYQNININDLTSGVSDLEFTLTYFV